MCRGLSRQVSRSTKFAPRTCVIGHAIRARTHTSPSIAAATARHRRRIRRHRPVPLVLVCAVPGVAIAVWSIVFASGVVAAVGRGVPRGPMEAWTLARRVSFPNLSLTLWFWRPASWISPGLCDGPSPRRVSSAIAGESRCVAGWAWAGSGVIAGDRRVIAVAQAAILVSCGSSRPHSGHRAPIARPFRL